MVWAIPIIAVVSFGSYTMGTFHHASSRAQAAQNPNNSTATVSASTQNNVNMSVGEAQTLSSWNQSQAVSAPSGATNQSYAKPSGTENNELQGELDSLLQALGFNQAGLPFGLGQGDGAAAGLHGKGHGKQHEDANHQDIGDD